MLRPSPIAILGAGLAGLTCAYRLSQKGIPVVIYEASARVGGRIHTKNVDGVGRWEAGAEFIRPGHKHILKLLNELKLPASSLEQNLNTAFFSQSVLIRDLRSNKQDIISSSHHIEYGYPPEEISCFDQIHSFDLENIGESKSLRILSGSSRLVESLANRLHGKIFFNCKVTGIYRPQDHYTVRTLYDTTESLFSHEVIIIALPYSVLRNIHIGEGLISEPRKKAIQSLKYGKHSKGARYRTKRTKNLEIHVDALYSCWPSLDEAFQVFFSPRKIDDTQHLIDQYDWGENRLSLGSYSIPSKDEEALGKRGFTIRERKKLFFIGEHLSESSPGHMDGAVETAEQCAEYFE